MIGLTGAHRTGKTTIAKQYAKQAGMTYVTLSTTDVIASMGLTCSEIVDLDTRLEVQSRLVQRCDYVFTQALKTAPFVADRTPIDVAAYTLADCGQHMTDRQMARAEKIVSDCFAITNGAFQLLMYVPQGIPYKEEPGKPPFNTMYQLHHGAICLGLLGDERSHVPYYYYVNEALDVASRIHALDKLWQSTAQELEAEKIAVAIH